MMTSVYWLAKDSWSGSSIEIDSEHETNEKQEGTVVNTAVLSHYMNTNGL